MAAEEKTAEKKIVKIPSTITVKSFGELLELPIATIITELMKNKIFATINEEIDFETASVIAEDLGYIAEPDLDVSEEETMTLEKLIDITAKEQKSGKNLHERPPIVTVLGHVDHGKTTLLDTIRKTSVAEAEAGGITQHISAYQTKKRGKIITFIDTPGHEAFAAMRERGVSIADIAILVVAADDGVRPQTLEVITYLKEKKIPTIVAISKIDKPEANVMKVKQELADHGLVFEEWGGKVMCNEISAKTNSGIGTLLENILLLSEVEDFKANTARTGLAVVLESHLDPQKGPIATVLVRTGTLKVGQDVVAGKTYGRIRHMEDYAGKSLQSAFPSTPVTLSGLVDAPHTNDIVHVMGGKVIARSKSEQTSTREDAKTAAKKKKDTTNKRLLPIVLKADVQGSLEAIEQVLGTISSEDVALEYIATGVANVTESDVKIAQSSHAKIFGFNVTVTPVAKRLAKDSGVEITTYTVIYELVEEIKRNLIALLPVEIIRTDLGELDVLEIFFTEKGRMILGGRARKGKISMRAKIDVFRGEKKIGTGTLANLQHNKVDIDEVKKDQECGITFEGETRIKKGDILHMYTEERKEKTL